MATTKQHLTHLESTGLIRLAQTQPELEYLFRHALMQDAAYESLLLADRKKLHRQVGEALERLYPELLNELSATLGRHFAQAGRVNKAIHYLHKAGDRARDLYAYREAVEYFGEALAFLENQDASKQAERRVQLYEGLGGSLWVSGQPEQAAEAYTLMRLAAEKIKNKELQARAWNGLARTWLRRDHEAMLKCAEQAIIAADEAGSRPELIKAMYNKGWALYRLGETETALGLAEQALAYSTELDLKLENAVILQLIGRIHAERLGEYDQAVHYQQQALTLCRELRNLVMVADTLSNIGESYRYRGDYQTAISYYEKALATAIEIGYRDGQMVFRSNLGGARVGLGDYQEAEADLRQVIRMPESTRWLALSEAYRFLTEACLGQEKLDDALITACNSLSAGLKGDQQEYIGVAWRILGVVALALSKSVTFEGKRYSASNCFTESLQVLSASGPELEEANTLQVWAEHEIDRGDKIRGQAMYQQSNQILKRIEEHHQKQ